MHCIACTAEGAVLTSCVSLSAAEPCHPSLSTPWPLQVAYWLLRWSRSLLSMSMFFGLMCFRALRPRRRPGPVAVPGARVQRAVLPYMSVRRDREETR